MYLSASSVGDAKGALEELRRRLTECPGDAAAHSQMLLVSHYGAPGRRSLYDEHRRWADLHAKIAAEARFDNDMDPGRRLHIGYVSADFRYSHPVTYFIAPVLREHDRRDFLVTCYSNSAPPDSATERMCGLADRWRDIYGWSDENAAAQVRADAIDILVDLSGHCGGNRLLLFGRRPAPVQVTWLGYPDTTGLRTMDYRLTDAIADPEGESDAYHSEKLVRLKSGFLCYEPPAEAPPVSALPSWFSGAITYGSFQYPAKITPEAIRIWAEVLRRVPRSRLLLHHCFSDYAMPGGRVRTRIVGLFAEQGIGEERLHFIGDVPLRRHLELYSHVDIALDTFPYSGTTTTCEALWMGVPVVTVEGCCHAGRVSTDILIRAGLAGLVSNSTAGYLERAVGLAADLDGLAQVRAALRPTMARSPLLDAAGFTRNLEAEYRTMWRLWRESNCRAERGRIAHCSQ